MGTNAAGGRLYTHIQTRIGVIIILYTHCGEIYGKISRRVFFFFLNPLITENFQHSRLVIIRTYVEILYKKRENFSRINRRNRWKNGVDVVQV